MKMLLQRMGLALVLVLSLAAHAPSTLYAQEPNLPSVESPAQQPTLTFGVSVGLTRTDFDNEASRFSEAGAGFTGGLHLTYRFLPSIAVQPEVYVALRRGEEDLGSLFEGAGHADVALGYLDLPLLLKTYLPGGATGTTPYLAAGPYVSTRLFTRTDDPNFVVEASDLDRDLRSWDYGLTAGFGLERSALHAGSVQRLLLDARYVWGLADLVDDAGRPALHTRGFRLAVGVGW